MLIRIIFGAFVVLAFSFSQTSLQAAAPDHCVEEPEFIYCVLDPTPTPEPTPVVGEGPEIPEFEMRLPALFR